MFRRVPTDTQETTVAPVSGLNRDDLRRKITGDRVYVWPPGGTNQYLSVTTALNSLPKPFLIPWAAKVVAETAVYKRDLLDKLIADNPEEAVRWLKGAHNSSRDAAARTGSTLHEIAELDALGASDDADTQMSRLSAEGQLKARQLRDFFSRIPHRLVDVETVIYNDRHRYAGTLDFLVEFTDPRITMMMPFPPGLVVMDLKTGKGVYPEYALQLAAYRGAQYHVDLDRGIRKEMHPTVGGCVLHVTTSSWALIPTITDADVYSTFLAVLELSKTLPLNDAWVGSPILRGRAGQ
jgi:hypothetical protein